MPLSKLAESLTRSSSRRTWSDSPSSCTHCRRLGAQPAPVAADGVDLAVVRHKAEGLRHRPAGLGVRGVALVKDGKRTLKVRVAQIGVKRRQLERRQQPLVNHGPAGQRTEVSSARSFGFGFLAETEEQHFKVRRFRSGSEKALLDHGKRIVRPRADNFRIDWHRTPTQAFQAALLRLGLDNFARRLFLSRRHENHAQPERRGQFDSSLLRVSCEPIFPGCESADRRRRHFVRRHPHLHDAPAGPGLRGRGPRSRAKPPRRFGRPGRHRRRRGLWLSDSDSSLQCLSSFDRGSTIENFDER